MSQTVKSWQKRVRWVENIDGDEFNLQRLSASELYEALDVPDGFLQTAFFVSCALCDDAGNRVVTRADGEAAVDYAKRALAGELRDLDAVVMTQIADSVQRKMTPPKVDSVVKNFDATTTPASP